MQDFAILLKHLRNLLVVYRWLALSSAFAIVLIGFTVVFAWPERFEAKARIYVDTQSILGPLFKEISTQNNEDQEIARLAKLVITRPNIERITYAADLQMAARSDRSREQIIASLIKDIEFGQLVGSPGVFQFAYKNQDAESAKRVVQSLVSLFLETSLRARRDNFDTATRFIEEQIRTLEQRLIVSEEALKQFKIKNLGQMPNQAGDYFGQISSLETQLRQARLELLQSQGSRDALRQEALSRSASKTNAPKNAAVQQTQTQTTASEATRATELVLAQARRQHLALSRKFTNLHPEVIQAAQAVEDAQSELLRLQQLDLQSDALSPKQARQEPVGPASASSAPGSGGARHSFEMAIADIEANIAALKIKITDTQARLTYLKQQGSQIPQVEADLAQLTREYENNRQQFDKLLSKREALRLGNQIGGANGGVAYQVIDPAHVSPWPVGPNRLLLLALVTLAAVCGAAGAVLLVDYLTPRFHDLATLARATGAPLLGGVSMVRNLEQQARDRLNTLSFAGAALMLSGGLFVTLIYQAYRIWLH
jgi:polysaccharide chain length determinant protein (PEP-CTERM system associated)